MIYTLKEEINVYGDAAKDRDISFDDLAVIFYERLRKKGT